MIESPFHFEMNGAGADLLPMLCSPPVGLFKERPTCMTDGNDGWSLTIKSLQPGETQLPSTTPWWAAFLSLVQDETALQSFEHGQSFLLQSPFFCC